MVDTKDILGYLKVLGCQEVWNRLNAEEQREGSKAIMGCYCRLMEALEKKEVLDGDCRVLLRQIRQREYLNASLMLPSTDPRLKAATEQTA